MLRSAIGPTHAAAPLAIPLSGEQFMRWTPAARGGYRGSSQRKRRWWRLSVRGHAYRHRRRIVLLILFFFFKTNLFALLGGGDTGSAVSEPASQPNPAQDETRSRSSNSCRSCSTTCRPRGRSCCRSRRALSTGTRSWCLSAITLSRLRRRAIRDRPVLLSGRREGLRRPGVFR